MNRVAEGFIGRDALRGEILLLAGSSAFAGAGMMMVGAARLGAPWSETTGLHFAFMDGLEIAVFAVFCIAGLLHTNRPLRLSLPVRLAATCLVVPVLLCIAPDFGISLPGPLYGIVALGWSGAFLVWLLANWAALSRIAPRMPSDARGEHVLSSTGPSTGHAGEYGFASAAE